MVVLISLIIFLVLILVLAGIGYYACRRITDKVRQFSNMAFGTNSIMEGFSKVEEDYAVTPKSVSAATSLYLPKITKDFPDFHYEEMKKRAENVILSYFRSLDEDNVSLLTEGTQELKDSLSMQLEMLKESGIKTHYEQIKIHQTEIFRYRKEKSRLSIVFQSSLEYIHYKQKDGKIVEGSQNTKKQSRVNVECIYIQDRDMIENLSDAALGVNCPNCGAPLKGVGAKICEYCGSPIIELNIRSWNFSDVKEL